jgi:YbbR domain-containing protein
MNNLVSIKHNATLKVISLIIGYGLWWTLSQSHPATMTVTIPVCVDTTSAQHNYDVPETVHVTVTGKRSTLSTIDFDNLALHVDGQQLHEGKNPVALCSTNLFLPEQVNVVHYWPTPITVTVTPASQQSESKGHAHTT